MTFASTSSDAIAAAAFQRYADASDRLQRTGLASDAMAARREWRRFAKAYLSPDEFVAIERADLPAFRGAA